MVMIPGSVLNSPWYLTFQVNRYSINSGGRAGRCISTGDPHLRTFDGFTYDHYRIGDYVLVKSKIRDFEVRKSLAVCMQLIDSLKLFHHLLFGHMLRAFRPKT